MMEIIKASIEYSGCTTYEAVYPFDNGDTLWIDEERFTKRK